MIKPFLNILLLDDDNNFAATQAENIRHRLHASYGLDKEVFFIESSTRLDTITETISSRNWDVVLCDLGWGDLNLEGIQILNDIKMSYPSVYAFLYTAQDPSDETVSQALQWKLNFIDDIIPIDEQDYTMRMVANIIDVFERKRSLLLSKKDPEDTIKLLEDFLKAESVHKNKMCEKNFAEGYLFKHVFPECHYLALTEPAFADDVAGVWRGKVLNIIDQLDHQTHEHDVSIRGTRLLPKNQRVAVIKDLSRELHDIQKRIQPLLNEQAESLAAEICVSQYELSIKIKENPIDQRLKKYNDLILNKKRFPRVEGHDLLALDKTSFIEFIKSTYGGFPQMAERRGLDLNNIYRVNRKFKNLPFIVFKYETIAEIIGIHNPDALNEKIARLLSQERQIRRVVNRLPR
ncbi:MAG: hypothetical protein HQM16_00415 [Deltaproteobacteria bacterium]|nr:hypothetical protein [Deltaproteobacteria bacterium]